jgi:hypothetical protein
MFEKDGYEVVRNLIPGRTRRQIEDSIRFLRTKGALKYDDGLVEKAFSAYGVPVTERLLQSLSPTISKLTGFPLYPTYSYLRLYLKGAVLPRHVDRASCEISVTLTISSEGTDPWPIFLDVNGRTVSVKLEPGDALIYRGQDLAHWRECFEGESQLQVFLHYVRQDGPYSRFRFDERKHIGLH